MSGTGSALVTFRGVGHSYRTRRGPVRAIDDFSLELRGGEIVGLAGPNGSGKSTLISLLLGFMRPTNGVVRIAGEEPRAFVERHGVGYVPELVHLPPRWELREALMRLATLAGVAPGERAMRTDRAIALLGIDEHRGKSVKQLSKGNLQRLAIAQALLRDERLFVFDEPTHGLDPVWTQRFRGIVGELRRSDRAILIASHNLDELQRVADRVAIIARGKLERIVDTRATDTAATTVYRIALASGAEHLLANVPDARPIGGDEYALPPMTLDQVNEVLGLLLVRGAVVRAFAPAHTALEQAFRDVVGGGGE
jgi:ABC-2 type transport system ATP-binding protein